MTGDPWNQAAESGGRERAHCVVFVANRGYALASSRTSLIDWFIQGGWRVVLATADDLESRGLSARGAELYPVWFKRGGLSPLSDILAWMRLRGIFRECRPELIQTYHAKPLILGSLCASRKSRGRPIVVNTITGIGSSLSGGSLMSGLAGFAYRLALRRSAMAVFQNSDDRSLFVSNGWVSSSKARLVVSSGVDLNRFRFVERRSKPDRALVVAMIGRLLHQKGVPEFVAVSRRLKEKGIRVRFLLAGEEDPTHPDAVSSDWLRQQTDIEYLGRLSCVEQLLETADVFLFPSYYREGVPRVILEAAATGLPTVAFDVPGVREAVTSGETGYLVPVRNVDLLTEKVVELLANDALRLRLGSNARQLIESNFNIDDICRTYMSMYRELGADVP